MKNKITELKKDELMNLIEENKSIRQILKKLNINSNGSGAYSTFKNHCLKLGIEIPCYKNENFCKINKIELKYILVKDSTYQNRARLKKRLVSEGILEYKCYGQGCSITNMWNGKAITLELDHMNGIHNDNRIENLRFLCPNCHSQTDTHSGKNLLKRR